MHILFSALGYKPAYRLGGPIASVALTAEALVRAGHRVTVFTTNGNLDRDLDVPVNQPVHVNGVEVWYFQRQPVAGSTLGRWMPRGNSVGFLYAPQMRVHLPDILRRVDIVHTQNPFIYSTLLLGRAAIRYPLPFFYQQRGALGGNHLKKRRWKKSVYISLFERRLLRRATRLIALTSEEVQSYRALGVQTPCHIVPNGIEFPAYRDRPRGTLNPAWKISSQDAVILFLGRLHETKGVDRLVEAFVPVARRIPAARLVLAGPDEGRLAGLLQQRLAAAELSDRAVIPGLVSGEEKLDLLARANLFCLPSLAEGFSMAVLEAMASGCPVLLSPDCNFPEVEQARVGRVVPSVPEDLTAALVDLLGDSSRLAEMGRRARVYVRDAYSIERTTSQLIQLYSSVLPARRPVPCRAVA